MKNIRVVKNIKVVKDIEVVWGADVAHYSGHSKEGREEKDRCTYRRREEQFA